MNTQMKLQSRDEQNDNDRSDNKIAEGNYNESSKIYDLNVI